MLHSAECQRQLLSNLAHWRWQQSHYVNYCKIVLSLLQCLHTGVLTPLLAVGGRQAHTVSCRSAASATTSCSAWRSAPCSPGICRAEAPRPSRSWPTLTQAHRPPALSGSKCGKSEVSRSVWAVQLLLNVCTPSADCCYCTRVEAGQGKPGQQVYSSSIVISGCTGCCVSSNSLLHAHYTRTICSALQSTSAQLKQHADKQQLLLPSLSRLWRWRPMLLAHRSGNVAAFLVLLYQLGGLDATATHHLGTLHNSERACSEPSRKL